MNLLVKHHFLQWQIQELPWGNFYSLWVPILYLTNVSKNENREKFEKCVHGRREVEKKCYIKCYSIA